MVEYRSRRRRGASNALNVFSVAKWTKLAFFGLVGAIILFVFMFFWFSRDLPTPGKITEAAEAQSTKIYDRNGIVLYDIYSGQENRTYVTLDNIPKTLQESTIAIEDKYFYTNSGYSVIGYLRGVLNFFVLRRATGGSTLTQQLVKNTLLSQERTLTRKIKEFILALQVDKKYTKQQILELYLNIAPYGGTAVGVEAASEQYFGKKAKDLNLVESAVLAGMPQLPSFYSPYGPNPKAYISRSTDVLRRMREDGYITRAQEENAVKQLSKVKFVGQRQSIKAPHFSFYIKELLKDEFEFTDNYIEQGGLRVTTTLDYKLQEKAEEIVKEEVDKARTLRVENGASMVINPQTGEILAMVGSKDFFATESATTGKVKKPFEGQFNVVTKASRQPGSSIKPVTYATALERGYTAASLIMDTKTVFANPGATEKDYIPENYDRKFRGPVQVRFALGNSLNLPAVKMLAQVGMKNMMTTAHTMGLTTLAPTTENINRFGLSITLGGGEVHMIDMAGAFSAFANGGYRVKPVAITKITDAKGKVLYENQDVARQRVISEEVAFIISHILLDNNARKDTFGPNSYLNVSGRSVAVKTGTTDDKRDNWTIGWTPKFLVVTWVGNNDNSPMNPVLASGVTGAAPIWNRVIREALKGTPNEEFKKPDNVEAVTIDAFGGGTPVDGQPTRVEYFIKGTQPQGPAAIYQELKVSKADNKKLASLSEIEHNEYDKKKFIVLQEKDPVSSDGKNRWQEGINAWINEAHKDDPLYHPPTETSDKKIEATSTPTPTAAVTITPTP